MSDFIFVILVDRDLDRIIRRCFKWFLWFLVGLAVAGIVTLLFYLLYLAILLLIKVLTLIYWALISGLLILPKLFESKLIEDPSLARSGPGLLYPFKSETREILSLDGVWTFLKSNPDKPTEGIDKGWFTKDLSEVGTTIPMPVPGSYNDVTKDMSLRDHVGTVWYERKFSVDLSWNKDRLVWIRFGSVHYSAKVWINGIQVAEHSIGHLPFEAEISSYLDFERKNRVTVFVDNVLTDTTIPQSSDQIVDTETGRKIEKQDTFDFFNYAGIRRSVHLYTTPAQFYTENVELHAESSGEMTYKVSVNGLNRYKVKATINVIDKKGVIIGRQTAPVNKENQILIENVIPWWPYLMHPNPGYLYTLEIRLSSPTGQDIDIYRMKFGFRTLSWTTTQFLINGKPVYFRGFGRHEDSDIHGEELDKVLMTKDFSLLKWTGANAYRTSHYPFSEESLQFADENGIMIVDECASVYTNGFTSTLLRNHKSALFQLIRRDRNHPSVVMWSVANEPRTSKLNADEYFKDIFEYTKSVDSSRPVTAALAMNPDDDFAGQYMDIISFNKYQNPEELNTIDIVDEIKAWFMKYVKPVLISEYGADTLEEHFKAFDELKSENFFIGEFICCFTDIKQGVSGNTKGVFTRNRQPKESAHTIRKRYHSLSNVDNANAIPFRLMSFNVAVLCQLYPYITKYYYSI